MISYFDLIIIGWQIKSETQRKNNKLLTQPRHGLTLLGRWFISLFFLFYLSLFFSTSSNGGKILFSVPFPAESSSSNRFPGPDLRRRWGRWRSTVHRSIRPVHTRRRLLLLRHKAAPGSPLSGSRCSKSAASPFRTADAMLSFLLSPAAS